MFKLPTRLRRKRPVKTPVQTPEPASTLWAAAEAEPAVPARRRSRKRRRRTNFRVGAASAMRLFLAPLGKRAARFHRSLASEDRLEQGLVVLLPGIDGCTTVIDNIARGLHMSDVQSAIEVHDWRSFTTWSPFHLTTSRNNQERAQQICDRIVAYHSEHPDRPIHLVGHSAGAGVALFVLQLLPPDVRIDAVVLLAAAISRGFDVEALRSRTSNGIWNFWSRGDIATVGLGTMIFGTMDRRHAASAGALGFRRQKPGTNDEPSPVHEVGYSLSMARHWNFGGHFGCTNAVFISRYVAPIVTGQVKSADELKARARSKSRRKRKAIQRET